ncbi:TetR/AcrR family transcriptional regulator [Halanaerocella petrolearia]
MKPKSKKEKIIQAAVKLFSQQGYYQTPVSEIADEAEVAKGTVYWYFDSKEELFYGIILSQFEYLYSQVEKVTNESNQSFTTKLEEVIRIYLKFNRDNKNIAKILRESSVSPNDHFHKEMKKFRSSLVNNLAKIIRKEQEVNQVSNKLDAKELANFILGSIMGSYNPIVYNLTDVEEKVDFVLSIILNGIDN